MGEPLVSIICDVYNHEPYLRQCLDGFVMQKTTFPFEVLIHDDASTDGSTDIIKEYEIMYPDLFKPIYQKENQYSKGINIWCDIQFPRARGKYIAICEGDDYWTDSLKLAKQFSVMERNDSISLCCTGCLIQKGEMIVNQKRYKNECIVPPEDIILGGGLWMHTVTYFFRNGLLDVYPDCCKQCHVGDYPLIIWASLNGGVYYLPDETAVYRFLNKGSWTERLGKLSIDTQIHGWRSEVNMLKGLDNWSNEVYSKAFNSRIGNYIYEEILNHRRDTCRIISVFRKEVKHFSIKQRFHVLFVSMHLEFVFLFILSIWRSLKRLFRSN